MDANQLPHGFIPWAKETAGCFNPDGGRRSRDVLAEVDIPILLGSENNFMRGPTMAGVKWPDVVMLEAAVYGWTETQQLQHELMHALNDLGGWQREIEGQFAEAREAKPVLERLCDVTQAFWLCPLTLFADAIGRFGYSALAVVHIQAHTRLTMRQALMRVVYDDPQQEVAGVLVRSGLVTYVATCNMVTPFWPCRPAPPNLELYPPDARGERASVIYA